MSAKLFTTQEVAQMIGFTDSRLRQLVATGKARPKQQLGGTWVFSQAEVNRLMHKRRKGKGIV